MLIAPKTDATPGLYVETDLVVSVAPIFQQLGELASSGYVVLLRDGREFRVTKDHGESLLRHLAK